MRFVFTRFNDGKDGGLQPGDYWNEGGANASMAREHKT